MMGSFNVAFLAVFIVIACGVSFLKVSADAINLHQKAVKPISYNYHCAFRCAPRCVCAVGGRCICGDQNESSLISGASRRVPSHCVKNSECDPMCGVAGYGYCTQTHHCICKNDQKESLVGNKGIYCSKASDCHTICYPGQIHKCIDGLCACVKQPPVENRGIYCSKASDCHTICYPGQIHKCINGLCACVKQQPQL